MIRGDIHVLKPPRRARGHEQRGPRLAVVLQATQLAALSTVIVAPTSQSATASPMRPTIEAGGERTQVMIDQLKAVDRGRLGRAIGHLTPDELTEVDTALRDVLALD